MLLTAYVIDEQKVGTELFSWSSAALNGNKPFKAESSVSEGYEDISSIINWSKFGLDTGRDFKFVRKEIQILAASIGFNNMNLEEKTICADWFSVVQADALTIYTIDELIEKGKEFSRLTTESRQTRFLACISEVYNRLSKAQANAIVDKITSDCLDYKYIKFGQESLANGDNVGIYDYVNSTASTPYEATGLSVQSYVPVGITLPQLIARLMDILANGNY